MPNISEKVEDFTSYINYVHGPEGIYSSGRNVTEEEVADVIKILKKDTRFQFQGDSFDRERARDILFTDEEFIQMYK